MRRITLLPLVGFLAAAALPALGAETLQESTPAEQAQTSVLNSHALENAQGTPTPASMPLMSAAPAFVPEGPGAAQAGVALNGLNPVPAEVATATVFTSDGHMVGAVQRVTMTADGHPDHVNVALLVDGQHRIVSLDAGGLRYNPADNTVISGMTAQEIYSRPGIVPEG